MRDRVLNTLAFEENTMPTAGLLFRDNARPDLLAKNALRGIDAISREHLASCSANLAPISWIQTTCPFDPIRRDSASDTGSSWECRMIRIDRL